jgi:hypothetical protein
VDLDADVLRPLNLQEAERFALVAEKNVSRVLDDDDLVRAGEVDDPPVEVLRRDGAGRRVRIVDDEQLGPLLDLGGQAFDIGVEAVLFG